jgi:hypothetical protein
MCIPCSRPIALQMVVKREEPSNSKRLRVLTSKATRWEIPSAYERCLENRVTILNFSQRYFIAQQDDLNRYQLRTEAPHFSLVKTRIKLNRPFDAGPRPTRAAILC